MRGLVARFQIAHLLTRYPERQVWALFMFLNGFITIALLAAVAMISRTPFVFPSLGPTAFLFFFTPRAPAAWPGTRCTGTPSASFAATARCGCSACSTRRRRW